MKAKQKHSQMNKSWDNLLLATNYKKYNKKYSEKFFRQEASDLRKK